MREEDLSNIMDDLIQIEEDRAFLVEQRKKGRPGCMLGIDRALYGRETRRAQREEAEFRRGEEERQRISQGSSDDEIANNPPSQTPKRRKLN